MKKKTKQEKLINMIKEFSNLNDEDQIYISGIIKGISLQKNFNNYQISNN